MERKRILNEKIWAFNIFMNNTKWYKLFEILEKNNIKNRIQK